MGGCNPTFSHSIDACVPAPVCQSKDYTFNGLKGITPIGKYLGDADKADWVAEGEPADYDGSLLLTMAQGTVGTVLSSTHYVWYGKTSVTMSTSQGAGVITAFILMSNARDEIDYEFVGANVGEAQTNYYFQGDIDYTHGKKLPVDDTRKNMHTYTVDWTPDKIDWIIDGQVRRTLNKADTWDPAKNHYKFPQTPSRIMISLWPAGLPTSPKGTVEWGGGLVEWDSPYMQNGYYYAVVKDVKVECYDPPKGAQIDGSKSYIYTDVSATNNTIKITDKKVVLKSLLGSGEKPDYDPNGTSSKGGSKTSSPNSPSNTPPSVPGMSGPGVGNHDDQGNSTDNPTDGTPSGTGGFSQATDDPGKASVNSPALGGSIFAVVVALSVLFSL